MRSFSSLAFLFWYKASIPNPSEPRKERNPAINVIRSPELQVDANHGDIAGILYAICTRIKGNKNKPNPIKTVCHICVLIQSRIFDIEYSLLDSISFTIPPSKPKRERGLHVGYSRIIRFVFVTSSRTFSCFTVSAERTCSKSFRCFSLSLMCSSRLFTAAISFSFLLAGTRVGLARIFSTTYAAGRGTITVYPFLVTSVAKSSNRLMTRRPSALIPSARIRYEDCVPEPMTFVRN